MMSFSVSIQMTPDEEFLAKCLLHRTSLQDSSLVSLYRLLGDDRAFELCKRNKITSIAADSLIYCGVKLNHRWIRELNNVSETIDEYMLELDRVAALLASSNIQLIALKNSGITRAIYPYHASSPMGDIDVLVAKDDFLVAHDILVKDGFLFKYRSPNETATPEHALKSGGAEYLVELPSGRHLWFELQWRPVSGRWIRPHQEPDTDDLFDRAISIPNSNAYILNPVDNLIQVCLHTAKHSYIRSPGFRLHTDVDRIIRASQIDWDLFCSTVRSLRIKTACYFSLALAESLLGTPTPQYVLCKLRPSLFKRTLIVIWLQRLNLFYPDDPKWNKFTYPLFVALLYDNLQSFLGSLFPSHLWIKQNTGSSFYLVGLFKYIFNILFVRSLAK